MTYEDVSSTLIPLRRSMALAKDARAQLDVVESEVGKLACHVKLRRLEQSSLVDAVFESAHSSGYIDAIGEGSYHLAISRGLKKGWANGSDVDERISWCSMETWDEDPVPDRQWAIRDRVPLLQAGLFSGEGGTGKSIIELMKCVAHVAGKDWLRSLPEVGGAFYLAAEDDEDEIHIRLSAIIKHYGVTFRELIDGGLKVMCLLGKDATLVASMGKSGSVETTELYRQVYEAAGDLKPKSISVDTLSRAFSGNEIDRVQVYGFAMHMQALAKVANGSVSVLSHPSLAGIASGSGISGSTAWHGAFRFRQYLTGVKSENGEPVDSDVRELQFKKNQYGPLGEKIVLRYQRGLFLPEKGISSLEKAAFAATAEAVTLKEIMNDRMNLSNNPCSGNYAPRLLAKTAACQKHNLMERDIEAAINSLLEMGRIRIEKYGRQSNPCYRLVAN